MINEVSTRFIAPRGGLSNRRGFTLVELLVSIGIILVLVAMLLPAARRSLEAARQVTCLSHLRQIGQAALMYCHDNDGNFPGLSGVEPPYSPPNYNGPLPYEWVYAEPLAPAPFNDPSKSPILRYMARRDTTVLQCPSDDPQSHLQVVHQMYGAYSFSYAINGWTAQWPVPSYSKLTYQQYNMIPAFRLSDVKNPSQTIFFVEEDPRFIDDGTFWDETFLPGGGWSEPASFVHDTYRNTFDLQTRTNVVFCDGHGEFVTQTFLQDRAHYDPRY